jgi:probable rRNA maturation factor
MAGVSIQNVTRTSIQSARSTFSKIAKEVLPGWDISLVFVGEKRARELNKNLRGKDYVPNVLSYSLGKKSGEIIICPLEAKRQAPTYKMSQRTFVLYLFIHGVLHVKGWVHSGKMEKCEQKLLATFAKG